MPVTIDALAHDRRHEQLPRQLLAGDRRGRLADARQARRRSTPQPIWINNTNALPSELVDDNDTFIVGFGARLRVRPTVYLVVEARAALRLHARRHARQLRASRSAPAATASSSTSRTASARRWRRSPAAASTTTTGISASTSRASSSRPMTLRGRNHVVTQTSKVEARNRGLHARIGSRLRRLEQPEQPGPERRQPRPERRDNHHRRQRVDLSPSTVTINPGESVTFVNNDTRGHDMASDPHPAHSRLPGDQRARRHRRRVRRG